MSTFIAVFAFFCHVNTQKGAESSREGAFGCGKGIFVLIVPRTVGSGAEKRCGAAGGPQQ